MRGKFAMLTAGLVLAAGCGGSPRTPKANPRVPATTAVTTATVAEGPLPKAAFVAKASAICSKSLTRTQALGRRPPSGAAALSYLRSRVGIVDEELNGLMSLPAPDGDGETVKLIVSDISREKIILETEVAFLEKDNGVVHDEVVKAVAGAEEGVAVQVQAVTEDAAAYGLTC